MAKKNKTNGYIKYKLHIKYNINKYNTDIVYCVTRGRSVYFYGAVMEMISPESHTILFLTSPMISVFFVPVDGSEIMFFEAAEWRENTDLQAVALICTYCERN